MTPNRYLACRALAARVTSMQAAKRSFISGPSDLQVLLARRAKPPGLGEWAFPGGSQEVGE